MAERTEPEMIGTADEQAKKASLVSGVYRYAVAFFLSALALMFISMPLIEQIEHGTAILAAILTLVLLFAVLAVGNSHRTLAWAILLVVPALAARWVHHLRPDMVPPEYWLVPGLLFIVFVIMHLFGFILRAPRVDSEVLCAAVAGYLMLALLWSFAYILVAEFVPGSFTFTAGPASTHAMEGFTALYFSFVTLCTVGYGDIVPVSGMARAMAMMEAAVGVFYVATLISRLVAVYSSKSAAGGKSP